MLNKKLKDKELYKKNMERLKECMEFEKNRLNIKLDPGSKVDVLDINSLKWYKGEVIKRTSITQKEKVHFCNETCKSSSLLYIEYKIDGNKTIGYFRADSMLLAPEGYFTQEDSVGRNFDARIFDEGFISGDDNSSSRIIRVLSRLNRILSLRSTGVSGI